MKEPKFTMTEENDELIQMYEDEITSNPTDAVVDDILYKLTKMDREMRDMEMRKQDSVDFYKKRIDRINDRMLRLSGVVEYYIRNETNRKTVETPNGVVRLRTTKKISWEKATDEELISFSLENEIDVKETVKPIRKAITEYIKSTGDAPDWFEESDETNFTYKLTGEKNE